MKKFTHIAITVFLWGMSSGVYGEDLKKGGAPFIIKAATIAPEGSAWMDVAHEYESYVRQRIGERIKFVWYAGGVMGDEPEMIRKIKLGQLNAGGFSGMGLGKLVPEVRVLELPLLFKSYEEVDYVREKLSGTFRRLFEDKGFVLLGWGEQGFIYVFTNKPVRSFNDLSGLKIWVWAGDNFARTIFDSLGLMTPIPIGVTEVLTSLQTGMINSFYNTPLGAVALQWYPYTKYIVNVPFTYGTGAIVAEKKYFDALPPDIKAALLEGGKTAFPKLLSSARHDNAQFLANFPNQGITFVEPDKGMEDEIRTKVEVAYRKLSGEFYPDWLLSGVRRALAEYRVNKNSKK